MIKDFRKIVREFAPKTANGSGQAIYCAVNAEDLREGPAFDRMIASMIRSIQAHRRERNGAETMVSVYYYMYDPFYPEKEHPRFVIKERVKQRYIRKLFGWLPVPSSEYSNEYTLAEIDDAQTVLSPGAIVVSGDTGLYWMIQKEAAEHLAFTGRYIKVKAEDRSYGPTRPHD